MVPVTITQLSYCRFDPLGYSLSTSGLNHFSRCLVASGSRQFSLFFLQRYFSLGLLDFSVHLCPRCHPVVSFTIILGFPLSLCIASSISCLFFFLANSPPLFFFLLENHFQKRLEKVFIGDNADYFLRIHHDVNCFCLLLAILSIRLTTIWPRKAK